MEFYGCPMTPRKHTSTKETRGILKGITTLRTPAISQKLTEGLNTTSSKGKILQRPKNLLSPRRKYGAENIATGNNPKNAETLQRPWRRIRGREIDSEIVFILARRNSEVLIDVGLNTSVMTQYTGIVATRTKSSLIDKSETPPHLMRKVVPIISRAMVRDANKRPLPLPGKANLTIPIGTKASPITFYVADKLTTPII